MTANNTPHRLGRGIPTEIEEELQNPPADTPELRETFAHFLVEQVQAEEVRQQLRRLKNLGNWLQWSGECGPGPQYFYCVLCRDVGDGPEDIQHTPECLLRLVDGDDP